MIDIYGITFNFTTFQKDKFTSIMGGILTIITVSLFLILFIMFGMPVYKKINPNVITQSIDLDYYPLYTVSNENYPLALRFENEKKIAIDLDGYLYPFLQLNKQQKNNYTGNMDTYNMTYFQFKKCDKKIVQDHSLEQDGWYCVDWNEFENMTIGGLYDAKNSFVNYFKITIFYCKFDGINYTNCTDFDKLNNLLNGKVKIYLSLMIPEVSTSPTIPSKPFSLYLTNYFFTLNPLLMRTDRFYHKRVKAKQDLGWIFEDYSYYEGYSMERRDTDIQLRTVDDYNNPTKIKTIATAVFYISNKVLEMQVNFMKFQNVLASVGGVLQVFQMLFTFTMYFLNFHLRYFFIVNDMFIFNFDEIIIKKPSVDNNQSHETNFSKIKGLSLDKISYIGMNTINDRLPTIKNENESIIKSPSFECINSHESNLTKIKEMSLDRISKIRMNTKNQNMVSTVNNILLEKDSKEICCVSYDIKNPSDLHEVKNKIRCHNFCLERENLVRKQTKAHQIPISTITTKKLISCCNDSKNNMYKLYIYAEEILKERLDILYYLKFISKMENFMSLFLNKQQRKVFKYFKNEEVTYENLNENTHEFFSLLFQDNYNEDEINFIIKYFKNKEKTNTLDPIDKKLLKKLIKN